MSTNETLPVATDLALMREVIAVDLPRDEGSGTSFATPLPGGSWRSEHVELDGRPLIRWRALYPARHYRVDRSVWFDPVTRLNVRKERTESDPATGRRVIHEVNHDHGYNEGAPAGTFELPPPGKPLVSKDLSTRFPDVTRPLPWWKRRRIERLIHCSDEGWRTGDCLRSATAWTFPRIDLRRTGPTRSDWEAKVRTQRGQWHRWESHVVSITRTGYFGISSSSSGWLMHKAPEMLSVKCRTHAQRAASERSWTGETEFDLQPTVLGYLIRHWECPLEEVRAATGADA